MRARSLRPGFFVRYTQTMRLHPAPTLLAALLLLPACTSKGKDKTAEGDAAANAIDPADLVPNPAEFVLAVKPRAVTSSAVYAAMRDPIEQEPGMREVIDAFEGCGLQPREFDTLVFGATADMDFVAVIVGDAVGTETNATCLVNAMRTSQGEPADAKIELQGGRKTLALEDSGRAFLVADDMLALTTAAWTDEVGQLLDGKGRPAVRHSRAGEFAKVDRKAPFWFLASMPKEVRDIGPMVGAPGLSDVNAAIGKVELSDGLALEMAFTLDEAGQADALAGELQTLVKTAAGAGDIGDLQSLIDGLAITAEDTDVVLKSTVGLDTIKALMRTL